MDFETRLEEVPPAHVVLQVNGKPVLASVDTGRSHTVISHDTAEALGVPGYAPIDVRSRAANSEPLQIYGKATPLEFCFSNVKTMNFAPLIAKRLSESILIGRDIIAAAKMRIDIADKKIYFADGNWMPLLEKEENFNLDSCCVHAKDDFSIPPCSVAIVPLQAKRSRDLFGRQGVLTATNRFTKKHEGTLSSKTLTVGDHTNTVLIELANIGTQPVYVKKGARVGIFEPLSPRLFVKMVGTVDDASRKIKRELMEGQHNLQEKIDAANKFFTEYVPDAGVREFVVKKFVRQIAEARISRERKEVLINFLCFYIHCFADEINSVDDTEQMFEINTEGEKPHASPPRRFPPHYRAFIKEFIQKFLKKGLIRPSKSPWAAPIVIVPKKDGSLRLCIDYRALNEVTKRDVYPMPHIDDALDALVGSIYFSIMDATSRVSPTQSPSTRRRKNGVYR